MRLEYVHASLYLPQPPELEVDVRPPPPEALHHDAPAEMLRVRSPEGQPVAQSGQAARITARARYSVEGVRVAVGQVECFFVPKGSEAVRPDAGEVRGRYAAAAVADADRDAGQGFVGGRRRVEVDRFGRRRGGRVRGRGDGHLDRGALLAAFDRGAEGVLEELRDDVLEMGGDVGEPGVGLAVDDDGGPDAVFELADLRDEGFAVADYVRRAEGGVDDADGGRGAVLGVWVGAAAVGLGGEVQGDVLLGDQSRSDPGPQVLV